MIIETAKSSRIFVKQRTLVLAQQTHQKPPTAAGMTAQTEKDRQKKRQTDREVVQRMAATLDDALASMAVAGVSALSESRRVPLGRPTRERLKWVK